MTASYTSNYTTINGLKFHYREWGDPTLPDLVLVHGWSTSGLVWQDVANELKDKYHVVAADNRGNGLTDRPQQGYLLESYANDICELINKLNLKSPDYIGHSWGGNIGTIIAAEYSNAVSKVILEDPVYWKMTDAFVTIVPKIISRRKSKETVQKEFSDAGKTPQEAEDEVTKFHSFTPAILRQISSVNRSWALECETFLAKCKSPTLLLIADWKAGGYITTEEFDHLKSIATSQAEFRLWAGVGHEMHFTEPSRLVNEALAFFSSGK